MVDVVVVVIAAVLTGAAGLLVALMDGSWTTLAAVACVVDGANLKMVACCSLFPELRRRLLGNTMICWCCWLVAAAIVCVFCWRGEGLTTNFFIVGCWLVLALVVVDANSTIILLVSMYNHE